MSTADLIRFVQRNADRVPSDIPGAHKVYGDFYLFKPGGVETMIDEIQTASEIAEEEARSDDSE